MHDNFSLIKGFISYRVTLTQVWKIIKFDFLLVNNQNNKSNVIITLLIDFSQLHDFNTKSNGGSSFHKGISCHCIFISCDT